MIGRKWGRIFRIWLLFVWTKPTGASAADLGVRPTGDKRNFRLVLVFLKAWHFYGF